MLLFYSRKGAIEEVSLSELNRSYFLIPKKGRGQRPILELRHLNFSLYKGNFKMLTLKTILASDLSKGLVCYHGPEGRLFQHPGNSTAQGVPQVRLLGERCANI